MKIERLKKETYLVVMGNVGSHFQLATMTHPTW